MKDYALLFIASLLSGILGGMGLGGGSVLILYLTIFAGVSQISAQGINLIFFIPIALTALIVYIKQKEIKFKSLLPFIIGGIPTSILSGFLAKSIKTEHLRALFGIFVFVFGLFQIFGREKNKNKT